jgi:hypothetical protein
MKNFFRILFLCFFSAAGIMLFQAQDYNGYKFEDDNNPLRDKPTREAFLHYHAMQNDGNDAIITDGLGFDNFDIGVDFAEQHASSNPINPLWLFYGVNGSPQNAWNSTNGGLNWQLVQPQYPGGTCCDPWSAYLINGKLIYGSGVSGQYIYTSTNNGNTWTSPVLSVSGNDRNTIGAELTGTGPYANYLYAAITPGNFARSTNEGVSWTTTFSSSNNVPGVMIAVGPNGSTNGGCVIYVTNTGSTVPVVYNFHRSLNGGASFTANVSSLNVAGYSGTLNAAGRLVVNNARHRPYPMIAMDNSNGPYRGRVYLVYSSNDPAGNGNKPDIFLQYSTDQASTWSTRIRVNDNANPTLSDQWFPAVWCEPITGKLYIKWYDTRENPAAYTTGVWATYSTTGGTSFATNQRISNASWLYPCPACGANQNCYRGDYDGITSNTKVGFAVWYDPRNCNYNTMGSYFPDFAMRVLPASVGCNGTNDSAFVYVSVPAVKLYSDTAMFSATILNPPGTGTITLTFLNRTTPATQNILTTFPDSLRLRMKTAGGVPNGLYNIRVQGNGPNGTPVHVRQFVLNVGFVGLHNNNSEVPEKFYLYQNYPNPFNPVTNIKFDMPKQGLVKLKVYDIAGREIAELVNKTLSAGSYNYDFDASGLSSGVYFYKLETPDFTSIRKMILVK